MKRLLRTLWAFCVGVLFCQNLLPALALFGWTMRLVQRSVNRRWILMSPVIKNSDEREAALRPLAGWPNWFFQEHPGHALTESRWAGTTLFQRISIYLRVPTQGLWVNLKLGVQGLLNTALLTLIPGFLLHFGWTYGWDNSFVKGYEKYYIGMLYSLIGIILFIAAMTYLPLAQCRQASTGKMSSFYQYRLIRALAKEKWISCLGLAGLYVLACLPLVAMTIIPGFVANDHPELIALSPVQQLEYLRNYYFKAGIVFVPIYILIRLAAARIYARGMAALAARGNLHSAELFPEERKTLEDLRLFQPMLEPERHGLAQALNWTATKSGRITTRVALPLVWFIFVFQIYFSNFFYYRPLIGFLNPPFVLLPLISYIPSDLKDLAAGKDISRKAAGGLSNPVMK